MTDFGVALVEIPIVAGKLDEAVKIFDEHPHGLKFTASQPGFISMTMSKDEEKHSIILMERWTKKEDWMAYGGRRAVKGESDLGESNKAWEAAVGPLMAGELLRMGAFDVEKSYGKVP
jgi:heme-degrading monooxygenase HmoA